VSIVRFENVTKEYPSASRVALGDVSFSIERGERLALLGNNGSGKTTLINSLMAVCAVDSGSIFYGEEKISSINVSFRKRVGFVPSFDNLIPDFTIEEYLEFVCKYQSVDYKCQQTNIQNLFSFFQFGSSLNKPIHSLSLGERTKVQIVASIVHRPECIVMDEPFAHLDFSSRERLLSFINSEHGKTWIVSTHDIELALRFCSHALVLKEGRVAGDFGIVTGLPIESVVAKVKEMLIC
jgi:ABC-type multidrug transport system ATPase subunit